VAFDSAYFNPRAALYTPGILPPVPDIHPLDNVHKASALLPAAARPTAVRLGVQHSASVAVRDATWLARGRGGSGAQQRHG